MRTALLAAVGLVTLPFASSAAVGSPAPADCTVQHFVQFNSYTDLAAVAGTARAGLPESLVLAPTPNATTLGQQIRDSLDGAKGTLRWRFAAPSGTVGIGGFADQRLTGSVPDDLLAIGLEPSGCWPLEVQRVRGANGTVGVERTLVPTVQPDENGLSVVALAHGDLMGQGYDSDVVEIRTYNDVGLTSPQNVYTADGRDATPGIPMRGRVLVIDGRTLGVDFAVDQPTALGPGPLSVITSGQGREALTVMTNLSGDSTAAHVLVRDYDHGHLRWTTRTEVLPEPLATLDLAAGPAFITQTPSPLIFQTGTGVGTTSRISVFDRNTGRKLWSQDLPGDVAGVQWFNVHGDLLMDDPGSGFAERFNAQTGRVVWKTAYASTLYAAGFHLLVGNAEGAGLPDLFIQDGATGATMISAATGAIRPLPLLTGAAVSTIADVGDLDGDGYDELAMLPAGNTSAGNSGAAPSIQVFDLRSGGLLWTAQLPAGNYTTALAGFAVGPDQRAVVAYQHGGAISAFDAKGHQVWSRPDPG